jgi:light-harvesting complex 1 beta chain
MANTTFRGAKQCPEHHSNNSYVIAWVTFFVFLLIAVLAQMLALDWRSWLPGAESEKSLIGGVKAAVYTFMSHLT